MDHLSILLRASALCAVSLAFAGLSPLKAQEAELPKAAPEAALPSPSPGATAAPTPTPSATIPPPQLIPPDVLPMPDQSTLPNATPAGPTLQQLDDALKPQPLSEASENYRKHIEWRKVRNQTQNDPAVKAALATAERARKDSEKRKLLARYYEIFYTRAAALGSAELRPYLKERKAEALKSLPQPRVRPGSATTTPKSTSAPTPAPDRSVPPPATPTASPFAYPSPARTP